MTSNPGMSDDFVYNSFDPHLQGAHYGGLHGDTLTGARQATHPLDGMVGVSDDDSLENLLRLREVVNDAKDLCMKLRLAGRSTDVESIVSELFATLHAPLRGGWDATSFQTSSFAPPNVWNDPSATADAATRGLGTLPTELAGLPKQSDEDFLRGTSGKWGAGGKEKGKKQRRHGAGGVPPNANDSVWRAPRAGRQDVMDLADGAGDVDGTTYAFVEFKRGRIRKYASIPDIPCGKYVMVDGDRGQDCGLLVQTIRKIPGQEDEIVCMEGTNIDDKLKLEDGRVIRLAKEEEVQRLHTVIASAEALALRTCRDRCKELNIEIGLVDVEYQYDMKKISFFFDCDHSVDFRSLVRELYRSFGARIWMENINPKVRNSMPEGASGPEQSGGNRKYK